MKKLTFAALAAASLLAISAFGGTSTVDTKTVAPAPEEKGPPLPLHAIDGGGGLLITPVAYLVNPTEHIAGFAGFPSASFTYAGADAKNVEAINVTETLFKRIELGYTGSRLGTNSFNDTIYHVAPSIHMSRSDVYLNTFTIRGLLLPENSFGCPFLPAITAGAQFKWNSGIRSINNDLGGALHAIGYQKSSGVDYTVTATKMLKYPFTLNRPLLLSCGVRFSKAAWLGYVGFGDNYNATVEANAAYSITDWLWLAGEYRQNPYPYTSGIKIGTYNVVRPALDWWDTGVCFILSKHATITVGYGNFGDVLNSDSRTGWAVQLKYEF